MKRPDGPFQAARGVLNAFGRVADVQLGKMLQPAATSALDIEVPYLRAGHLSQVPDELPRMWASPRDLIQYRVEIGDLLVAEGGDVGRVGFVPEHAAGSLIQNSLHRVRPRADRDQRFLLYVLEAVYRGDWLEVLCNKSTFGHLTVEKLTALRVPDPPAVMQRAIADYLDTETARIDALITKKKRMIELLEERFQAAIRDRLASLAAPLLPLKRAWRVVDCKHLTPTYVDEGFPVVSPGDVSPGRLDLLRATRFVNLHDLDDLADGPRRPRRGDIIYSRNASIGTAAYVDTDERFCMGQDVCLISSTDQNQLFLTYVLNTVGLDQLDVQKIGSTFSRINISQIVELLVPVPGSSVQMELAGEFDRMADRSRGAKSKLKHQIGLLLEHRQALITAAVTGELEIPGVAA